MLANGKTQLPLKFKSGRCLSQLTNLRSNMFVKPEPVRQRKVLCGVGSNVIVVVMT